MLMALPNAPTPFTLFPSLQYGEAPDLPSWHASLQLDILCPFPEPSSPVPAVIYLHGGGWVEGDRSVGLYPWLNPLLAAHGLVALSITYRLSHLAPFPAQIHDAKAAVRWVRAHVEQYHIDPETSGSGETRQEDYSLPYSASQETCQTWKVIVDQRSIPAVCRQ